MSSLSFARRCVASCTAVCGVALVSAWVAVVAVAVTASVGGCSNASAPSANPSQEVTRRVVAALGSTTGQWKEQGPAPITGTPSVTGAVESIVADPSGSSNLFVGSVNGGVWGTTSAAVNGGPIWTPLTDTLPSLSIHGLAMDPTNSQVVLAGTGGTSNLGSVSGTQGFIYKTIDGGFHWTIANDGSPVVNANISALAIRGTVGLGTATSGQILRSTDSGSHWASINGTGNLPGTLGAAFDLVSDPTKAGRYYAAVGAGTASGVFRTDDFGANWIELAVNDPAPNPVVPGVITLTLQEAMRNADNARLSVASGGRLYVATSANGHNVYVGFTDNQGSKWTAMDIPRFPNGSSQAPIGPAAITNVSSASNGSVIVVTTAANHKLDVTSGLTRVRIAGVAGYPAANGDWRVGAAPPSMPGGPPPPNQFILVDRLTGQFAPASVNFTVFGGTWQQWFDVNTNGMAVHNLVVAGDPTDSTVSYVSGDEFVSFLGTSTIVRGSSKAGTSGAIPSAQWTNLSGKPIPQLPGTGTAANPAGGTANNTDVHEDTRFMTFDATGALLLSSDGGIFRRSSPRGNTGDWVSLNATLGTVEMHDVAIDTASNVLFGGAQDNGTPSQALTMSGGMATPSLLWTLLGFQDGGHVEVDTTTIAPSSIRYFSANNLGSFSSATFNANNVQQGSSTPLALVISGQAPNTLFTVEVDSNGNSDLPFITQFALNKTNQKRMVIGGRISVYESFDQGATVTPLVTLAPDAGVAPFPANATKLAYGHPSNPEALWVAAPGFQTNGGMNAPGGVFNRLTKGGMLTETSPSFPGGSALSVTMSAPDPNVAYAISGSRVFVFDASAAAPSWTDVTGDLPTTVGSLHDIVYLTNGTGDRIVVSTDTGVYQTLVVSTGTPGTWSKLGNNLPNALAYSLSYASKGDELAVATMGRGVWTISGASGLNLDTDNDGWPDFMDNCPTVPNPFQENTNYLAEYVDEQNGGCTDFGGHCLGLDVLPPGSGPIADAFHQVFFGDACDPVVSTGVGKTGFVFSDGTTGPCGLRVLAGGTGCAIRVSTGGTCPTNLDSNLSFESWVGNADGTAPTAVNAGSTSASFCRCDMVAADHASQVACSRIAAPCIIAVDNTAPGAPQNPASGWKSMSQLAAPGTPSPPVSVTTTFQERIGVPPPQSVSASWDFLKDTTAFGFNASALAMNGVVWGHVDSFMGQSQCLSRAPDCNLVANLNSSYVAMRVSAESTQTTVNEGPCTRPVYEPWLWPQIIAGLIGPNDPGEVPWVRAVGLPGAIDVVQQLGSQLSIVTSQFSTRSLGLLGGVQQGLSDLIIGDDVATGVLAGATPPGVLIVQAGTTNVIGALDVANGVIDTEAPESPVIGTLAPPAVRSYAAYDQKLYALSATPGPLQIVDVAAALNETSATSTMPLTGTIPVLPMAMVWNRFTRTLYAVDKLPVNAIPQWRVRLLTIDPATGVSTLLWQTQPTRYPPSGVTLSVSRQAEVVLAMSGVLNNQTEVLLMDKTGRASLSDDPPGALIAPAYAVPAGVNLAFEAQGQSSTGLQAELRPRSRFRNGTCGANYLLQKADPNPPSAQLLTGDCGN